MTDLLKRAADKHAYLDPAAERECVRLVQEHNDRRALERLLYSQLRLVFSRAKRYYLSGIAFDELVAEGNLGLVIAVRRYDPTKGMRFGSYAQLWIDAQLFAFVQAQRRVVRLATTRKSRLLYSQLGKARRKLEQELMRPATRDELAAYFGLQVSDIERMESTRDLSIESTLETEPFSLPAPGASPESLTMSREETARIRACIARAGLDPREALVVHERFLADEPRLLADIGREMGVTREWVRQLELRAIKKLRTALAWAQ